MFAFVVDNPTFVVDLFEFDHWEANVFVFGKMYLTLSLIVIFGQDNMLPSGLIMVVICSPADGMCPPRSRDLGPG